MARFKGTSGGSNMTKALGRMIGLLLSLYVFDQVIEAVLPNLCTSTGETLGGSVLEVSSAGLSTCTWTNGSATQDIAYGGYFGTSVSFVNNLFPVVGILGAFEIIYSALRGAKLV